jgi:hypothetical protein
MRADYLYGFDTAEMIGSKKRETKRDEGRAVCGEKSKRRRQQSRHSQGGKKKIALTRGGEGECEGNEAKRMRQNTRRGEERKEFVRENKQNKNETKKRQNRGK